ncbi:UDP-glucuronosyl/UDP-glucosyltransferase [Dillenia turbinata]|uniref:Glycosyltransferase n=1 Tax=Dillenia turbinata TaxID=194707 RepID=A0AAN8VYL3_9MAGN
MSVNNTIEGGHVAVIAFPFTSHVGPLLGLVKRLAAEAPEVMFSFFATHRSNKANFSDEEFLHNIRPFDVEDGLPEGFIPKGHPQEPVELFLKATPNNFKKSIEVAVSEIGREVTCVLSDAFLWICGKMAEEKGVPWIALITGGPFALTAHLYTDVIRQTFADKSLEECEEEPLKFIPGLSSVLVKDLPEGILSGNLESEFPKMLHNMSRMLPKATAVCVNSFEEIDPTVTNVLKSNFKKFLCVGPLSLTMSSQPASDEYDCLPWLDKYKPASVVYISFGSVIPLPPSEVIPLTEALEESGFPFLWSVRGNTKELIPKGFLERTAERGKIVPWTPQTQVLAHESVGAFVTHSGWKSICESIAGGVPMICRPFFGDQALNTRIVEDVWGIGFGIKSGAIAKYEMLSVLERTLVGEEGKKRRNKIGKLKGLAEMAVESGGSSTENFKTLLEIVTSVNI